jgi:hypothetical protein
LRCAANAAPAVVAEVGHNGLYLGLDYKLSAVFNPMVFRSLDDIDWPDALVDSICAFGENVTESSDDDRNHRAFFELVEALKISRARRFATTNHRRSLGRTARTSTVDS